MAARHLFTLALGLAVSAALPVVPVMAQDAPLPEVANSKFNFAGTINANSVYVRSGPAENYYATAKLDTGANVTVVGIKFDWLKIVPPEGSYSYVAKQYVKKTGEGRGVVERSALNVRAGSTLNELKTTVQTQLDEGTDVKILGEKDEYWKIAPPAGTYLYVKKEYVTPGKPLPAANVPAVTDAAPVMETPVISEPIKPAPVAEKKPDAEKPAEVAKTEEPKAGPTEVSTTVTETTEVAAAPTTAPAATQPAEMSAEAPSTQPAKLSAAAEFDKLEGEFATFSRQPILEQPLADAVARYEALAADRELAESMRRVVDVRLATLRTRLEAHNEFVAVKASQDAARERRVAMEAEKAELQERIEKSKVTIYTAVGTLRTSSLQVGPSVLYRLTDPSTGRTLVYLRSSDATYATMIGQFIGVQGNVEVDSTTSLKYISPTATKIVNPSDVGGSVTAQMIPQSILQGSGTANVGQQ
ncbi:MAG TPA: hypothetical protein VGN72_05145 [Tepidisphaeraceae bacterium]|jgi:hypothetical protein|nr:hypothetical protein [Tepidisphaeraceae bacterium]